MDNTEALNLLLDDVPERYLKYVKETQKLNNCNDALELIQALGIRLAVADRNLAMPGIPAILVERHFFETNNDVLRHELSHCLLKWSGLQEWLETAEHETEANYMLEWLCNRTTPFFLASQELINAVIDEYGVSSAALLAVQKLCKCSLEDAATRIIQDDPEAIRASFIVKSGVVAHVEQCNFRLPFWKWDKVSAEKVMKIFPPEIQVSMNEIQGGFIGVVSL